MPQPRGGQGKHSSGHGPGVGRLLRPATSGVDVRPATSGVDVTARPSGLGPETGVTGAAMRAGRGRDGGPSVGPRLRGGYGRRAVVARAGVGPGHRLGRYPARSRCRLRQATTAPARPGRAMQASAIRKAGDVGVEARAPATT